jgi:hypothetical protein
MPLNAKNLAYKMKYASLMKTCLQEAKIKD